jgi:coenzyme F420-0:L-glutamate ligase / coenzyme F420-1:gamma-L-glutamate ligase
VADEVAAAADLVKGKASRVPAALLRGVPRPRGDGRARDLVRPPADDLFRTAGTAEDLLAFLEGGPPPAAFLPDPVDAATLQRAAAAAGAVPLPGGHRFRAVAVPAAARAACLAALSPTATPPGEVPALLAGAPALLACCLGPGQPGGDAAAGVELAAGGAVRTLLLGLHALGVAAVVAPAGPAARPALAAALGLDPGWLPLGLLAAGYPG